MRVWAYRLGVAIALFTPALVLGQTAPRSGLPPAASGRGVIMPSAQQRKSRCTPNGAGRAQNQNPQRIGRSAFGFNKRVRERIHDGQGEGRCDKGPIIPAKTPLRQPGERKPQRKSGRIAPLGRGR
jgi:hypothetical protein